MVRRGEYSPTPARRVQEVTIELLLEDWIGNLDGSNLRGLQPRNHFARLFCVFLFIVIRTRRVGEMFFLGERRLLVAIV